MRPNRRRIGDRIALEAQAWIGTPFAWGQAQKQRGCDCKGLVEGVARELGRPEAASVYGLHRGYRPDRPVPSALLKEGLAALFDQVAAGEERAGDVLLFDLAGRARVPQHLAIMAIGGERVIHADIASMSVRERRLAAFLKDHRLNSAWRWRQLAKGHSDG